MSRFLNDEEPNKHDRLSVRPREAAELLGISPSSLDRLVRDEDIPCFKVRGMRRFSTESLKSWVRMKERDHKNE